MGSKRVSRCSRLIFDPLEIQPASSNNCLFACDEKIEKKKKRLSLLNADSERTATFHIDSFYQTQSEAMISKGGRIIHKVEGFCMCLSVLYTVPMQNNHWLCVCYICMNLLVLSFLSPSPERVTDRSPKTSRLKAQAEVATPIQRWCCFLTMFRLQAKTSPDC